MADDKPDVLDATHQLIVLTFDLADAEIGRLPEQIAAALKSPQVEASIKKTLLDFSKTKVQTGNTVVPDDEAKKLFETLGTGVKDAASKELMEQIKKTPEFKKLEKSLEEFKQAAQSSALGVWIDKNKNVLYVVGAALVVGTAGVLYITKTGGPVLNTGLSPLKGKNIEVLQIGKLKVSAGLWDFQPDARIFGARVISTVAWEKVSLELKLGVLAKGAEIQQVEGSAVVKSKQFNMTFTSVAKPQVQQVNLGLNLGFEGGAGSGKVNLSIGATYQDSLLGGTVGAGYKTKNDVSLGLQGNVGQTKEGGVGYGGLLTLTIPFK